MVALKAIITGNAAPLRRELKDIENAVSRMGTGIGRGLGTGHLKTGAMREFLVLIREISAGNWNKVPGSFSILVQQLGVLRFLLNPITIGLAALGATAFFVVKHFMQLARESKNIAELMDLTTVKFSTQARVMKQAAEEAQGFRDWLRRVGDAEMSVADQIGHTIKMMRERSRMDKEIATNKGASKKKIADMDIAEAKAELKALEEAKKIATWKLALDKRVAISAENAANNPARKGKIEEATTKSHELGQVVDAIEKKMKETTIREVNAEASRAAAVAGGHGIIYKPSRAANETDVFHVKVGEKEYGMSLRDAKFKLHELTRIETRLVAVQKELSDAVERKKKAVEKDAGEVKKLTQERNDLAEELKLKQKMLPQIATTHHAANHGHLSALQVQGAYAGEVRNDTKKMLHHLASIDRKMGGSLNNLGRVKH